MSVSKIGLGTVQFGLAYGVSNTVGQTPAAEVRTILTEAAAAGVRVIDTAPSYGESEAVLGQSLPAGHNFDIVTKGPRWDATPDKLREYFASSLSQMGVEKVHGLITHTAEDLLGPGGDDLWAAMTELRDSGQIQRIGASAYDGTQVEAMLERYPLEIVQVPLNIFDQRLLAGGQLELLLRNGVHVHVRSAFLQGLLLMDPRTLHPYFEEIKPRVAAYQAAAKEAGLTPLAAALRFVTNLPQITAVVCGVNTLAQLHGILQAAKPGADAGTTTVDFTAHALHDPQEKFLHPYKWPNAQ